MKKIVILLITVILITNVNFVFATQSNGQAVQTAKVQKQASFWHKLMNSKIVKKVKQLPSKLFKAKYDRLTLALIFMILGILFLALGSLGKIVYVVGVIFFLVGVVFLLLYLL